MFNTDASSDAILSAPGIPLSRTPRLAVFGGSFDPVHNAHLQLAQTLIDADYSDEILFVPCRRPPHKDSRSMADGNHRLNMLKLAIEPYPEFAVSDIEMMRTEGYSYTFDTMSVLKEVFTEHHLFFLMGSDSLAHLHEWHRAPELVSRFDFLIYPRPKAPCPSLAQLAGRFGMRQAKKLIGSLVEGIPEYDLSATEVRIRAAAGEEIASMCPAAVSEYIRANKLYVRTN